MLTDIEIAQQAKMKKIGEIAANLGIEEDEVEQYGHYKAKLNQNLFNRLADKPDGKLILVTAINPTPAGEGKTTTSVGLCEAMNKTGRKAILALREPSLGPVFGIKGGAAGGGYAQVVPMEDINLHFTGDMHAITAANNLLAALMDNHIQQGNALGIDVRRILFKRCLDMNDRALRNIVIGMGGIPVGALDFFELDPINRRAGIGILIHDDALRGKGYASDAVETACRYACEVLNLHQLWCNVGSDNAPSRRLFAKAGFAEVGVKRDWLWRPGGYGDEILLQKILG